jgi:hypothetical protein
MDTHAYLTFLAIGVGMVIIDGQILYHSGRRYLMASYGDPAAGASMARLITVLFHLAVLGLLALLSTIDIGDPNSMPSIVGKLGVMLLVLAAAHGVTLSILGRLRDEQVMETAVTRRGGDSDQHGTNGPVITPVPGQRGGRYPAISPTLEHQAPYSTPE